MTIKATYLLELFARAGQLDLSTFVKQDEDGNYVVKFYELYTNNFDETIVITQKGEDDWNKGTCSCEYLMDTFVDMLSEKEQEELKAQKLQELIARLSDEERELLGLGVSSKSVPHKSQLPF